MSIQLSSSTFSGESIIVKTDVVAQQIEEVVLNENHIAANYVYSPVSLNFGIENSVTGSTSDSIHPGGFLITSSAEVEIAKTDFWLDPDFPSASIGIRCPLASSFVTGRVYLSGTDGTLTGTFSFNSSVNFQSRSVNLKPLGLGGMCEMRVTGDKFAGSTPDYAFDLIYLTSIPVSSSFNS